MVDKVRSSRDDRRINAKLYKALSEEDDDKVRKICLELPDGPFHRLTIHNDSILHVASYYQRNQLVLDLIRLLPEDQSDKLTLKNGSGKTILHAMATNNKTITAAEEMLRHAPSLLTMTDNGGETPFFSAARYGETNIFHFLKDQVIKKYPAEEDLRNFLLRDNKTTILHVAIHSENFKLAYDIAKTYPILIDQEDEDGMTGLQLLACKPSAFDIRFKNSSFKRFIYKFIDLTPNSGAPIIKEIRKQIAKRKAANNLANILIESDSSWEATEPLSNHNRIKLHKYVGATTSSTTQELSSSPNSPLFLATKYGCTDIVKEILRVYPQAVEHIDEDGRNILHVAIKYRRMEIYNTVISMKNSLLRLRGKIDNQGNSILHMVGIKVKDQYNEVDIRSPAIILRDDLLLLESVKSICTNSTTLQINEDGMRAEQLFINNNAQLRIDAKEWMKGTAEHCSIVAVLIATVAFAAAYTVPGGPDQKTGYPVLKSKPFFIVFALADALSLTFSLTSVIVFLSILTSSFRLRDFKNFLHDKLMLGLTLLIFSVSMMMVAFAATLILIISSGKLDWTNILLYIISFFPVTVFVCSYVRLYNLLINAFKERVKKIIASILPEPAVELPSQAPTTDFTKSTPSTSFV